MDDNNNNKNINYTMNNSKNEIPTTEPIFENPSDPFIVGQWTTMALTLLLCVVLLFPNTMFLQRFLNAMRLIFTVLLLIVVGALKSILPARFLPKKSIRGKILLVTGSGGGMGRLMAIEFGKRGARVVLWDINEKMNLETKQMLEDLGVEASAYQIDLSDREQIYALAERVKREVGEVDILVNNAGIVSGKKLFECPDELMEKSMAINCNALFYTTKAFLPAMIKRREGHIVNIASVAGLAGVSGLVDYCASKHGAVGFSDALRAELVGQGLPITVTTVCPYFVNTGMFDGVKTFTPFLFPILEPHYVVGRIVQAVLTDADELYLPAASYILVALKGIVPTKVANAFSEYFGFNRAMNTWKGRGEGGETGNVLNECGGGGFKEMNQENGDGSKNSIGE